MRSFCRRACRTTCRRTTFRGSSWLWCGRASIFARSRPATRAFSASRRFIRAMMTALLLHTYASGIYSSRRIAKGCSERADFMMIVAGDPPDFGTISEFRKRHLKVLARLFVQVLRLCEAAGLVKLGHV